MLLQKKDAMTNYILNAILKLLLLVPLVSCASQKSQDDSKTAPPSLDGIPANYDGTWNGSCSSRSYDGKDNFDGPAILTIEQTETSIEIRGYCYKEKPSGQYFKANKLTIYGNDLIDEKTGFSKGKIGSTAVSIKSSRTSAEAPGASIESVIDIQDQEQNQIVFEYFEDGVNASARMRAITINGNAKRSSSKLVNHHPKREVLIESCICTPYR